MIKGVEIRGGVEGRFAEALTAEALVFVGDLHRRFNPRREELLARRAAVRERLAGGGTLDFLDETREVREGDWRVAPAPAALADRRVEITGPTDRKMVVNALNSGATGFMADFEDANSPTWQNMVGGQLNLIDAVAGTIELATSDERTYRLAERTATLLVRPRGWHLPERHILVDGDPVSAALFDFGLFVFHNAQPLVAKGAAPYLYLPKLESHLEARLWNDVLAHAEEQLGLPPATMRATVLIETVPAAFEMDEILYELRDRSTGLNAGRWDYLFSMIKCFRERPQFVLPNRDQITMTVPFMRAYSDLLVKTCHRRGAHAIGGMAAFIPSRARPDVTERALAAVRADKRREAEAGFDGTWVAHPDLVEVARAEFDAKLGGRPNQLDRQRDDVSVAAGDLLDAASAHGSVTEVGVRNNIHAALGYISWWLRGTGAVAIMNLMEDAATAEIARSQLWQWIRHGTRLDSGEQVTAEMVRWLEGDELGRIQEEVGDAFFRGRTDETRALFEQVALGEEFVEFLTLAGYERLAENAPTEPRVDVLPP